MSVDALLAEKLPEYRSMFDRACASLFDGGEGVTVELDDDDDFASATENASSNGAAKSSNGGSKPDLDVSRGTAIQAEVWRGLHAIAADFAQEFNRKLSAAAKEDASVAMVASNYEMTSAHVDELAAALAGAVQPLVDKLRAGDLEAARRASVDAWTPLERRLRTKWQAYFVFTFQDVSVERKAARDRRSLQQRFDPDSAPHATGPSPRLRALPDFAPPEAGVRTRSPWIAVLALLLLAAAGGWLLLRHNHIASAFSAGQRR